MPVLYVTETNAVVRKSGESFIVTLDEDPDGKGPLPERRRKLIEVEPHRLELIALVGRTHITSDAMLHCLEKGIIVAYFSWSGDFLGRMVPENAKSADLRIKQYQAAVDPIQKLGRAKAVASAKLANGIQVLEDIQKNNDKTFEMQYILQQDAKYRC